MEVVSTSNLVSLEKKRTCNFQTMAMNSFVMPYDLMRGWIGKYAYMQTRNVKKCPKKHLYIKQQIKTDQQ